MPQVMKAEVFNTGLSKSGFLCTPEVDRCATIGTWKDQVRVDPTFLRRIYH